MAESLSFTSFKQKFDNQLTCAVCLDQYTNPKTLPCYHSFCLECIRRLPVDSKGDRYNLICPTCRVEHPLPEGGADEFPNAFHINSLLELRDDLTKKETHSTVPALKMAEPLLKFEDLLTCSVCLYQYTNPKILPCHHSFCLECIRRLPLDRKGDRYCLSCPTCRVEHPLSEGGVDEFPNMNTKTYIPVADLSTAISADSSTVKYLDYGVILELATPFTSPTRTDNNRSPHPKEITLFGFESVSAAPYIASIRVYADQETPSSYTFPEDTTPVSALYSISLPGSVSAHKLMLRHCADPNNPEELEQLRFVKTSKDSSMIFEEVPGGVFEPGQQYGEITPQHMCTWSIVRSITRHFEKTYIGTVLYQEVKNRQSYNWLMKLIVARNNPVSTNAFFEYLMSRRSKYYRDDDDIFSFKFISSHSPKLELKAAQDSRRGRHGWEIRLKVPQISQEFADRFQSPQSVPAICEVQIQTHHHPCRLSELPTLSLNGIVSDRKDLQVNPPVCSDSSFETHCTKLVVTAPWPSSFGVTPTLDVTLYLTKRYSMKYNSIGQELKVPYNFREEMHRDMSRASESKLEAILYTWIQTECSPVTWDNFIIVMEVLGFEDIVSAVKGKLNIPEDTVTDDEDLADEERRLPDSLAGGTDSDLTDEQRRLPDSVGTDHYERCCFIY